jgi:hypothetical protein
MAKHRKHHEVEGEAQPPYLGLSAPDGEGKDEEDDDSERKNDLILAGILFLIALIIRLYFLNAGLWYTDAVIAAQAAEATYNTHTLHYMHGVGYPGDVVVITILYALFKLIGGAMSAEFATLFSSFFSAALSVGLIYLLVKRLTDSTFAGVSTALVLNFLPVYLSTSTFGMDHQLAVFFILLSFYLALLASKNDDYRLKVLASASLGWAAAVRLESLMMLPLMLLFYWKDRFPFSFWAKEGYARFKLTQNKDELLKDLAYLIIPMLILLLLPYSPMLRDYGFNPLWGAFEYNKWLGFWVPGLTTLVIDWVSLSMTTLGWILAAAGLLALFTRKNKNVFFIVLLWCAYFFVLANTATVEDRHTIPALVGFTVAIGCALDWIYQKIHQLVGVAVLLLLVGMMFAYIQPVLDYRAGFCGPKAFAFTLKDMVEQNSVIIVMDEGPHLQYYGKLDTIGHPLDGDDVKINQSLAEIDGYLSNGTSVYLVSSAFVYDNPGALSYDSSSGTLYNANTREIYSNLVYNPSSKSISDRSTGVSIPLFGLWQVELFSGFMVMPVKTVENEDWHKKSVMLGIYNETVFKILKRNTPAK